MEPFLLALVPVGHEAKGSIEDFAVLECLLVLDFRLSITEVSSSLETQHNYIFNNYQSLERVRVMARL